MNLHFVVKTGKGLYRVSGDGKRRSKVGSVPPSTPRHLSLYIWSFLNWKVSLHLSVIDTVTVIE